MISAPGSGAEIMKIYTRGGDKGETGLIGGARRSKADARIAAYGEVDELCAALGVAGASLRESADREKIRVLQEELFQVGAILTSPDPAKAGVPLPDAAAVERMEKWIDEAEARLPPLRQFILPGGSAGGAALHLARCVCRRAERAVVALGAAETAPARPVPPGVVVYLTRRSDWLFVWARDVNARAGAPETPWAGKGG